MGRNKYPEITENLILETAMKLFIEKGYEQTTLQDIADAIGMTRGAIYHHFKDKAEMVDSVMACMFHKTVPYEEIKSNREISALEKIRRILIYAVTADEQVGVYFLLSRSLVNNPKLAAAYIDFTKNNLTAVFCELIKEGMEDGTIGVKEPEIMAELLSVVFNLWISPIIFMDSKEKFTAKLKYAADILAGVGLPIMNQEVEDAFEKIIAALPE
ncbi:TetR/AcrR family transcriptional regulator [Eisenbergiella sp.]